MNTDVASYGVEELWEGFMRRRSEKWQRGVGEHRDGGAGGFVGCPVKEATEEVVDLANYMDEAFRQGLICEDERAEIESTALELWIHLHSVLQR